MKTRSKYARTRLAWSLIRRNSATAAIWTLLVTIFLIDAVTTSDNISVCFAYAIPIFVSLFEERPKPFLYAGIATALSFAGTLIQAPGEAGFVTIFANRLIAVVTQWLTASLVRAQRQRISDVEEEADYQRRFLDILSHEIGTALTSVSGHAHRLNRLAGGIAPEDIRLRAGKIRAAAERIEAIIGRIKFAASLGNEIIPAALGPVDLQEVIRQVIDQMDEDSKACPIELTLCPQPQVVSGDETLLRHVFENAIMNSIKYSSPGAPIQISVVEAGPNTLITIADNGSGIAAHELTRIRRPYYRGENSRGTGGAGLGLYIAERVLDAHGGRMEIDSAVGRGTIVVIVLPRLMTPVPA